MIACGRSAAISDGAKREHEVERGNRRRISLFWLAIPSALFVVVNALRALGIIPQALHRRIALLHGGQPGATVVLASAIAAFAIAIDRVAAVSAEEGRRSLKIQASYQTALVFVLALLGFAWLYTREYAWQYAWLY